MITICFSYNEVLCLREKGENNIYCSFPPAIFSFVLLPYEIYRRIPVEKQTEHKRKIIFQPEKKIPAVKVGSHRVRSSGVRQA